MTPRRLHSIGEAIAAFMAIGIFLGMCVMFLRWVGML